MGERLHYFNIKFSLFQINPFLYNAFLNNIIKIVHFILNNNITIFNFILGFFSRPYFFQLSNYIIKYT